jgi:hypothetical protein
MTVRTRFISLTGIFQISTDLVVRGLAKRRLDPCPIPLSIKAAGFRTVSGPSPFL